MAAAESRPNPLPPLARGRRAGVRFLVLVLLSILFMSCEAISYYSQAARGQLKILTGRQEMRPSGKRDLIQDLRDKFELILQIREFALSELELPVGDNYLTYVDVGRACSLECICCRNCLRRLSAGATPLLDVCLSGLLFGV